MLQYNLPFSHTYQSRLDGLKFRMNTAEEEIHTILEAFNFFKYPSVGEKIFSCQLVARTLDVHLPSDEISSTNDAVA